MKKVLILAYDFPPYSSVGGIRPHSWFKYLSEFGIMPVVVTRQWNNKYGNYLDYVAPGNSPDTIIEESETGTIIRTPYKANLSNRILLKYGTSRYKMIRKIVSAYYEFFQFIFLVGPKSQLYFGAKKYLQENKVDVIIATGDPFILFRYASKLSRKFLIPWIADYRDPWTEDVKSEQNGIVRKWNNFFEKRYGKTTSAVTTVSNFLKKQIENNVPSKPFHILPNGYDPGNVELACGIEQDKEYFNIYFVGTVYKWYPLESFLNACNDFARNVPNAKLRINFIGINVEDEIKELINTKFPELDAYLRIYPRIPNEKLLQTIASGHVFLLFNSYALMGTKIYDYMALKRQIILCYSEDQDEDTNTLVEKYYRIDNHFAESQNLQEELIQETNSGVVVRSKEHLVEVLSGFYSEFIKSGEVKCNSAKTEKYSRKIQVEELAGIINDISKKRSN